MKKTFLLLVCLHIAVVLNAQLIVDSRGNVGIQCTSSSKSLKIGGRNMGFTSSIEPTKGDGLYIRTGNGGNERRGLQIATDLASDTATSSIYITQVTGISNKATYGIKSCSGISTKGSFGIAGGLYGISHHVTTHGAGIYGSANSVLLPFQDAGIYAGYFRGDVRVTGTLYGTLLTPSGNVNASHPVVGTVRSYEVNGEELEEESVSNKLQQVQLLQFYRSPEENKLSEEEIEEQKEALRKARLMEEEEKLDALSASEQSGSVKEEGVALERDEFEDQIEYEVPQTKMSTIRYGLAADQLKEVYPELVYEDENGNVSINYIEMIPLLVQAVNEVKRENASLREEVSALKGESAAAAKGRGAFNASAINTPDEAILSLGQNKPNPFSSSTSIEVTIPESVKSASLFIYDMSGKQIKRIDIAESGISQISITSEGLAEGMYLYSLIADGKMAGTKKMILTK